MYLCECNRYAYVHVCQISNERFIMSTVSSSRVNTTLTVHAQGKYRNKLEGQKKINCSCYSIAFYSC